MSKMPGSMLVADLVAAIVATPAGRFLTRRDAGDRCSAWRWLAVSGVGWTLSGALRTTADALNYGGSPWTTSISVALLLLPLCAVFGMVRHCALRNMAPHDRIQLSLNAASVLLALLALVWHLPGITTSGPSPGWGESPLVTGCVVPDGLVISVVLSMLTHGRVRPGSRSRSTLGGLLVAASADMAGCVAFAYHATVVVGLAQLLGIVGFGVIALAARREVIEPAEMDGDLGAGNALPQVVIGVCGLVVTGRWIAGAAVEPAPMALLAGVGILALIRQHLLLDTSRRLLAQIDDHRASQRRSEGRDPLTGLPNRAAFTAMLLEAVAHAAERPFTVVQFRPNQAHLLDDLDTGTTDTIVVELAHRISGYLGSGERLARVSDATFAVILDGEGTGVVEVVREVMLAAEGPVNTPSLRVQLSLAAGLATASKPGAAASNPHSADLAQHAAIALGTVATLPGGMATFTPAMIEDHVIRSRLREAVTQTLRESPAAAVTVLFEPVVELSSGHLVGMAARADWHLDGHEALSAGDLTSLAREAGMTNRVDRTVLDAAIGSFARWHHQWPSLCRQLWVTLCGDSIVDADFFYRLAALLAEADLPPEALVLEPLDDRPSTSAHQNGLRRLRKLGVKIATSDALVLPDPSEARAAPDSDPHGHDGYADYFDISPVLVDRCVDDVRARRLVQATIEFAAGQNAATTARQVTRITQHEQLRDLGANLARGLLYGAPLGPQATEDLVARAAEGTWQTPARQESQRRRSSEAWRELRHVVNQLPIAAFACDSTGTLVLAEGALLDSLCLPVGPFDRQLTDLVGEAGTTPNERPLDAPLVQALRGVASVTTLAAKNAWLQIHLCARREPGGAITGALGVAIDITHRMQAENALRSSDRRFREVFSQAPVGMVIVGPDTRIVQVNPALATMLGYVPDDLVGRTITSLLHPDTPKESEEQYAALRAGTITGYCAERAYTHRDGSAVWTRVAFGTLIEAAVAGTTLGVIEDLRQIKQLEVELRHAQKLEAVGMLAAGIAHEINTPIQFISDNTNFLVHAFQQVTKVHDTARRLVTASGDAALAELEVASEEADLPWLLNEIPRAASHNLEGTAQVANIVRAMRNFGHPDQREPSPVEINAAIQDTAIIAQNEIKYVADLHLDLADVPVVLGYQSELNQVILNLLVNASHAIADADNPPGKRGSIQVKTWADSEAVFMSIADDGCGMTTETRARIFDPFFTTKAVGRGTGQGLAIAHSVIVEKHHGSIRVDSLPGTGATFTIRLPLPDDEFAF